MEGETLPLRQGVSTTLRWWRGSSNRDGCYWNPSPDAKRLVEPPLFGTCRLDIYRLSNHSHTEQDRALCVLERALPAELLRQLSWLGRITHTQSKTEHSVF